MMNFNPMEIELMEMAEKCETPLENFPHKIKMWEKAGYKLSKSSYFIPITITTQHSSSTKYRLKMLDALIKSDLFIYNKNETPDYFVTTFALSAYWLREEAFHKTAYKKTMADTGNGGFHSPHPLLIQMLDIGMALHQKGFDLSIRLNDKNAGAYANQFLEQCQKRIEYFSPKVIASKKKSQSEPTNEKIKIKS